MATVPVLGCSSRVVGVGLREADGAGVLFETDGMLPNALTARAMKLPLGTSPTPLLSVHRRHVMQNFRNGDIVSTEQRMPLLW